MYHKREDLNSLLFLKALDTIALHKMKILLDYWKGRVNYLNMRKSDPNMRLLDNTL